MANTKISALPANNNPTGNEELVYALNNSNGKMSLSTMKTFANTGQQTALVSWVNIKTINNESILWSWNIDTSWWWGGSRQPTELSGDANIWELSEGVYVTDYDLYFKTWEKVPAAWNLYQRRQMLFVAEEVGWDKWYFVYSVSSSDSSYAAFWYSNSSSVGKCNSLWSKDWCLKHYGSAGVMSTAAGPIGEDSLTQIVENAYGNTILGVSSQHPPYVWVTYTIYISSVASGQNYDVYLWTWVTNPFGFTLPDASTKQCLITLLATSSTTAIITECKIAS